jgi:hypothetical protein
MSPKDHAASIIQAQYRCVWARVSSGGHTQTIVMMHSAGTSVGPLELLNRQTELAPEKHRVFVVALHYIVPC